MPETKCYFIYILKCVNQTYYTGYTTDIGRRYKEHQNGSSKCKYTRSFPPIGIVACWQIEANISIVLKLERAIKAMNRNQKTHLIAQPENIKRCIDNGEFTIFPILHSLASTTLCRQKT